MKRILVIRSPDCAQRVATEDRRMVQSCGVHIR